MKKSKRSLTALVCAAVMCLGLFGLAGCSPNEPDPTDTPAPAGPTGVYDGSYSAGGFLQDCYIRLHEMGEVVEGRQTFYFHAYSGEGASAQAMVKELLGVWELSDSETTMNTASGPDQRTLDNADLTAAQTITFKSLDGSATYFTTGYDAENDRLLGIPKDNALGVTSYYCEYCFLHTDEAKTDRGVALESFYADVGETRNASILIYHDGTYGDNLVAGSEAGTGTWKKDGSSYTLTPESSGLTGGVLAVNGASATFTPEGGEAIEMKNEKTRSPLYILTGAGTIPGEEGDIDADYTLTLNDDNSAILHVASAVADSEVEGTWSEVDGSYLVSCSLLDGNAVLTEVTENGETRLTATLRLVSDVSVTVTSEPIEPSGALYVFTGEAQVYSATCPLTLELFADGSAQWTTELPESYGGTQAMPGTWTQDSGKPTTLAITGLDAVDFVDNGDGTFSVTLNDMTVTSGGETGGSEAAYTLSATLYDGYLTYTLELFPDKTAVFTNEQTGSDPVVVSGTWTEEGGEPVSADLGGGTIVLTITKEGDVYTATNGAEGQMNVTVTSEG